MTRYFIDQFGVYLGGFDGAKPPANAIEVPFPPDHALKKWDGAVWSLPAPVAALAQIEALEATVTQRRLREALLTPEGSDWLSAVEVQIAALRGQL